MTVTRTGTTPTPFGFVGGSQYQSDTDSGLMLLGHRYYDASVGRFISLDPIQDGDNWYAYCDNNPLTGIDPEGLQSKGNQGLPKQRITIDADQRQRLEEELKDLKEKGSRPDDRPRIKEIERKLGTDDKAHGDKGSRHSDHNKANNPKEGDKGGDEPKREKPDPKKIIVQGAATVGLGYLIYRGIRMIPSFFPPLWWTLPGNAAVP